MKTIWRNTPEFKLLISRLEGDCRTTAVTGPDGSAAASFLSAFAEAIRRPLVIVVPEVATAVDLARDIRFFRADAGKALLIGRSDESEPVLREEAAGSVVVFPEPVRDEDDTEQAKSVFMAHMSSSLQAVMAQDLPIAVIPARFLAVRCHRKLDFSRDTRLLQAGDTIALNDLIRTLADIGYQRASRVENAAEFSFRGGILDVFIPAYTLPVRLEFFGDEIVSIREFDPLTQRSISKVQAARIIPAGKRETSLESGVFMSILDDWFGTRFVSVWLHPEQIQDILHAADPDRFETFPIDRFPGDRRIVWDSIAVPVSGDDTPIELEVSQADTFNGDLKLFLTKLENWLMKGSQVRIVYHRESIRRLIEERIVEAEVDGRFLPTGVSRAGLDFVQGHLSRGFRLPSAGWVFLSETDVVGVKKQQAWRRVERDEPGLSFQDLKSGDLVVHVDHGIGQYQGLQRIAVEGRSRDFLLIVYSEGQKLYVPVDRLNLIQRYVAAKGVHPVLDHLGTHTFRKRKAKVREEVLKLAAELLKLFSVRQTIEGFAFPADDTYQREFEMGFEYEETPDQLQAISEIKTGMEKPNPMDRLVCGDVGFGKTEVAMRAAFKAAINGKQVAVLVPTTILAQQHFKTFVNRFRNFPVQIAMLSRFLRPQDARVVRQKIGEGVIDIVVGTHALLAESVEFRNLGLLIIDEEHRFGVKHKEKLKLLREKIDVLTLTATPIPRTLNMSMLGLRDISIINTPPEARLPIITRVQKFDQGLIRKAILDEIERGGQVFFVHNHVQSIHALADLLRKLVPEARFEIGHGQMPEAQLEKIMLRFLEREFDVLIATTIIESGLDIPSVNTIIINRADRLGLAQLYQLRGRVGRDRYQAYAFLLVPVSAKMTSQARERLNAIREAVELGSGFKLAMRDLEIRGAGDILGPNQHGQISAVGFEMYCQLMRDAIHELKGDPPEELPECDIKLPVETSIPDQYISEPAHRVAVYRKLAVLDDPDGIDAYLNELSDRYGPVPPEMLALADFMKLRAECRRLHIESIDMDRSAVRMLFRESTPASPERLTGLLLKSPGRYAFDPPRTLRLLLTNRNDPMLIQTIRNTLHALR